MGNEGDHLVGKLGRFKVRARVHFARETGWTKGTVQRTLYGQKTSPDLPKNVQREFGQGQHDFLWSTGAPPLKQSQPLYEASFRGGCWDDEVRYPNLCPTINEQPVRKVDVCLRRRHFCGWLERWCEYLAEAKASWKLISDNYRSANPPLEPAISLAVNAGALEFHQLRRRVYEANHHERPVVFEDRGGNRESDDKLQWNSSTTTVIVNQRKPSDSHNGKSEVAAI